MNANGRVNILEQPTTNVFSLYDKIPINENTSEYRQAMKGTFESTELSNSYFSKNNIDVLQNTLIQEVYKQSGGRYQIGYQDSDTLKIIMRSIFLQHSSNLKTNIAGQIHSLNRKVLEYCVPQICGEAAAYIQYKNDISTLAVPLNRPVSTYANNILELKKFF
tara:strand:- start:126 stop:614 length:489 start_codon:yes stop_codon:yes gene_type:complete